jgi:N-acetylglucosamine kinase-like BadF-type ATPase
MKLLIDSGATKSEFILMNETSQVHHFLTKGINPNYNDDQHITKVFDHFIQSLDSISIPDIKEVVYYGAGCISEVNSKRIYQLMQPIFYDTKIEVFSDLMAVCHALCEDKPGYIGILGTGSATCYYDGVQIVERAPSLGYFLGDEGSGTYIGKSFIQNYLKNKLPKELVDSFETQFKITVPEVYTKVYRELNHQSFFGMIPHFLEHYLDVPEVKAIILNAFCDFFYAQSDHYQKEQIEWNLSGSIAYHFSEIVHEAALKSGYKVNKIIKAPLQQLILNHQKS